MGMVVLRVFALLHRLKTDLSDGILVSNDYFKPLLVGFVIGQTAALKRLRQPEKRFQAALLSDFKKSIKACAARVLWRFCG